MTLQREDIIYLRRHTQSSPGRRPLSSVTQSVFCETARSASPVNLLEMWAKDPVPNLLNWNLYRCGPSVCFLQMFQVILMHTKVLYQLTIHLNKRFMWQMVPYKIKCHRKIYY